MPRVSYPGAPGAFSHEAAQAAFPHCDSLVPFASWEDAALSIVDGHCDYGIFPIGNTLAGDVPLTSDLLLKYPLRIVREVSLMIRQHLLGLAGVCLADLRAVTSHPHAIKQCNHFLVLHPWLTIVPSQSTALSAKAVAASQDPTLAAIGAMAAKDIYGLEIIAHDIHNDADNRTLFVVVQKEGCL